jgi:peptidoglycan/LPS O-acetylase OafA/YrhL
VLPSLDALRAIASMGVLLSHVGFQTGLTLRESWGGFVGRGEVYVAIFFVLSGFLLTQQWAYAAANGARRPSTGRFYWNRALRIIPAYWIVVVVCLIVLAGDRPAYLHDWIRYFTFTETYWPGWGQHGLTQTWTLGPEMLFYLLLPGLAAVAIGRTWRPVRAATIVVCIGVAVTTGWLVAMSVGALSTQRHTTWLPTYAAWYCAGVALAIAHVALRTGTAPARWRVLDQLAAAPGACWLMALGFFAVATTPIAGALDFSYFGADELAFKLTLVLAAAVMVFIPTAFGPDTRYKRAMSVRPARWLGRVSYGVFLWHAFVLDMVFKIRGLRVFSGDTSDIFVYTVAGSLVFASLSYYLLERPVQRWGRNWLKRRQQRREPQRADGGEGGQLRADGVVGVVNGQIEPAGHTQEGRRQPDLQRA